MQTKSFRKGLVVCIIALFIGLAFIPSFNAVSISMLENHPPEAPKIKLKEIIDPLHTASFTFKAIDPDDDCVRYFIDWDDGTTEWTDCFPSDFPITISHTWEKQGTFFIRARANDTHGALGPWGYWQWSKEDKEEDCDCQSNGKTHLAEKLLNKLEKNEVLSNVIDLENLEDDRPICIILKSLATHFANLYYKYFMLVYSSTFGTLKYWIYFLLMMNSGAIGIFILKIYSSLSCGE